MVKCDKCGTDQNVKRAFVTVWNGHIIDLCLLCAKPFVELLDPIVGRWPEVAR